MNVIALLRGDHIPADGSDDNDDSVSDKSKNSCVSFDRNEEASSSSSKDAPVQAVYEVLNFFFL